MTKDKFQKLANKKGGEDAVVYESPNGVFLITKDNRVFHAKTGKTKEGIIKVKEKVMMITMIGEDVENNKYTFQNTGKTYTRKTAEGLSETVSLDKNEESQEIVDAVRNALERGRVVTKKTKVEKIHLTDYDEAIITILREDMERVEKGWGENLEEKIRKAVEENSRWDLSNTGNAKKDAEYNGCINNFNDIVKLIREENGLEITPAEVKYEPAPVVSEAGTTEIAVARASVVRGLSAVGELKAQQEKDKAETPVEEEYFTGLQEIIISILQKDMEGVEKGWGENLKQKIKTAVEENSRWNLSNTGNAEKDAEYNKCIEQVNKLIDEVREDKEYFTELQEKLIAKLQENMEGVEKGWGKNLKQKIKTAVKENSRWNLSNTGDAEKDARYNKYIELVNETIDIIKNKDLEKADKGVERSSNRKANDVEEVVVEGYQFGAVAGYDELTEEKPAEVVERSVESKSEEKENVEELREYASGALGKVGLSPEELPDGTYFQLVDEEKNDVLHEDKYSIFAKDDSIKKPENGKFYYYTDDKFYEITPETSKALNTYLENVRNGAFVEDIENSIYFEVKDGKLVEDTTVAGKVENMNSITPAGEETEIEETEIKYVASVGEGAIYNKFENLKLLKDGEVTGGVVTPILDTGVINDAINSLKEGGRKKFNFIDISCLESVICTKIAEELFDNYSDYIKESNFFELNESGKFKTQNNNLYYNRLLLSEYGKNFVYECKKIIEESTGSNQEMESFDGRLGFWAFDIVKKRSPELLVEVDPSIEPGVNSERSVEEASIEYVTSVGKDAIYNKFEGLKVLKIREVTKDGIIKPVLDAEVVKNAINTLKEDGKKIFYYEDGVALEDAICFQIAEELFDNYSDYIKGSNFFESNEERKLKIKDPFNSSPNKELVLGEDGKKFVAECIEIVKSAGGFTGTYRGQDFDESLEYWAYNAVVRKEPNLLEISPEVEEMVPLSTDGLGFVNFETGEGASADEPLPEGYYGFADGDTPTSEEGSAGSVGTPTTTPEVPIGGGSEPSEGSREDDMSNEEDQNKIKELENRVRELELSNVEERSKREAVVKSRRGWKLAFAAVAGALAATAIAFTVLFNTKPATPVIEPIQKEPTPPPPTTSIDSVETVVNTNDILFAFDGVTVITQSEIDYTLPNGETTIQPNGFDTNAIQEIIESLTENGETFDDESIETFGLALGTEIADELFVNYKEYLAGSDFFEFNEDGTLKTDDSGNIVLGEDGNEFVNNLENLFDDLSINISTTSTEDSLKSSFQESLMSSFLSTLAENVKIAGITQITENTNEGENTDEEIDDELTGEGDTSGENDGSGEENEGDITDEGTGEGTDSEEGKDSEGVVTPDDETGESTDDGDTSGENEDSSDEGTDNEEENDNEGENTDEEIDDELTDEGDTSGENDGSGDENEGDTTGEGTDYEGDKGSGSGSVSIPDKGTGGSTGGKEDKDDESDTSEEENDNEEDLISAMNSEGYDMTSINSAITRAGANLSTESVEKSTIIDGVLYVFTSVGNMYTFEVGDVTTTTALNTVLNNNISGTKYSDVSAMVSDDDLDNVAYYLVNSNDSATSAYAKVTRTGTTSTVEMIVFYDNDNDTIVDDVTERTYTVTSTAGKRIQDADAITAVIIGYKDGLVVEETTTTSTTLEGVNYDTSSLSSLSASEYYFSGTDSLDREK